MRLFPLMFALFAAWAASAQSVDNERGHRQFDNTCAVCHGGNGMGGEFGPAIVRRLRQLDDRQLTALIHQGLSDRGMPAFPNLTAAPLANLIGFLRTLRPEPERPIVKRTVRSTSGASIEGTVLSQSNEDLALQTADDR